MSWFTEMFCPASCRRSTKQRESPGTTSTTQTMWAVSISSARSPLACSTCWMRRASKTELPMIHSVSVMSFVSEWELNLFSLSFCLRLCSSFPHATDETLLAKFKQQHQGNKYFVPTPVMEPAFVIRHFAGKVKYQIKVSRTMDLLLHLNVT